ncbi:MAG TPA: DUF5977 domain-containing protein, partial [Terriglobales bacterium]|nr:DUF5977 domain-containing protein [Terriglobales bacterium]
PDLIGNVTNGGSKVIKISSVSPDCNKTVVSNKILDYVGATAQTISAGPQYFSVTVIYTDLNGATKTLTKRVQIGQCTSVQYETVNIGSQSPVYVTITPFNEPPMDLSATITVSVQANAEFVTPSQDDWCSEIEYRQIEAHNVQNYFNRIRRTGCFLDIGAFLARPDVGIHPLPTRPAVATDLGLPPGLPSLPLGNHYAQTSTDKKKRSQMGLWAMERGKIYILPWIQSTEKIVIKWDGIKREWSDEDLIDPDPLLKRAIVEYVRWDHLTFYEKDYDAAGKAREALDMARQDLWKQCRDETMIRGKEVSLARTAVTTNLALFYNTKQMATASCAIGTTGNPVTITIDPGTVASNVSVADANSKAIAQAQQQAQAQLVCQSPIATYQNTPQTFTASCQSSGGIQPDGDPITVTTPAGRYSSTISQADADSKALAAAQDEATSQLVCTFWNTEQSFTAKCPASTTGADVTKTTTAHTVSSLVSQDDANAVALNNAKTAAQSALSCSGSPTIFFNTIQQVNRTATCTVIKGAIVQACGVSVTLVVSPSRFSSTVSQADANLQALNFAGNQATLIAQSRCSQGLCGGYQAVL